MATSDAVPAGPGSPAGADPRDAAAIETVAVPPDPLGPPVAAEAPGAPDAGLPPPAPSGAPAARRPARGRVERADGPPRRARPTGRAAERVHDEPAFVLHAIPWRETSLVVELFTRGHGRIACVAKGAKRPRSALRGVLHAFQPLHVGFSGRNELRTLTSAEWLGGMAAPQGDALLCGFYMNELLVRLLPRDDPHPQLFDAYAQALVALGLGASVEATLRRYEWLLLREIGYAVDLERDADDREIDARRRYALVPGRGFLAADAAEEGGFSGETLLDMAGERYESARTLAEAKRLTRAMLSRHLDGQALKTRQILMDLHKL